MVASWLVFAALVLLAAAIPALAADDILDAIDQARKTYQAGDLATAKQLLETASQLVGQKNADAFATVLPAALPGWTAEADAKLAYAKAVDIAKLSKM